MSQLPDQEPLLPAHQQGAQDAKHEDKCRRCGVSCHVAVPLPSRLGDARDRAIVVPGLHCKFLAEEAPGQFACTVYADRFTQAPWCHHADVAGPLGYLADDCPYGMPDRGKRRVSEAEFREVWPHLWRILRSWGVPNFVHHEHFLEAMRQRTGRSWELVPMHPTSPGDQPFAVDTQQMRLRATTTSPDA